MATRHLVTPKNTRSWVSCAVCRDEQSIPYLQGRGYNIVRCPTCGLHYVNPQPMDTELRSFYETFDFHHEWRGSGEERFDRKMRDILVGFRKGGTVLDIGSSKGNFLIAMRAAGFDVFGVEPSRKNSAFARSVNGINTYTGTVEEFLETKPLRCFDIITIFNVLEHLRDPRKVLHDLRELLAKGGILVVIVPNARLHALVGGFRQMLRCSDPFWMDAERHPLVGFDPPAHLWSFEPKTISRLIESSGLRIAAVHNAPIILNQDSWKNVAKVLLSAVSQVMYFGSGRRMVVSHSTLVVATA